MVFSKIDVCPEPLDACLERGNTKTSRTSTWESAHKTCQKIQVGVQGEPVRILQNMKSCGLLAPRWHESPSPTAASPPGGDAGGACRESFKTPRVSVVVLRTLFYEQLHLRASHFLCDTKSVTCQKIIHGERRILQNIKSCGRTHRHWLPRTTCILG